jgi:Domain of unknown function (DUF4091)
MGHERMYGLGISRSAAARGLAAAATSLLAFLALAAPSSAAAAANVSAYDSLATIRADMPLPAGGGPSAVISAAGNEFESFQLAVQAGSEPLGGVSVEAGALNGPGAASIPASALTIYREAQYTVTQPSDGEGAAGNWPDALIPERDTFYGEDRNAFPYDLAPGQKVAVWVDVLVPPHQRSGVYRGSVRVLSPSGLVDRVPVRLRVYDFSIPSTSSLRSLFAIRGVSLPGGDQSLFAAAALDNRVTLANVWPFPESRFTSSILPLLQGTDPRVRLPGARLTALEAYHCADGCLAEWRDLAQKYPVVGDRFIDYICDEPESAEDWADCDATAASAESIWPGVRKLVTSGAAEAPAWATDLSPNVDQIDREGNAAYRSYRVRRHRGARSSRAPKRRLWPYTSCDSFSCDEYQSHEYDGWPGYVIDEPSSQARAMGWLSFQTGAAGELYWSTSRSISTAWTSSYLSGGNGDGNLFYPGTPDVISGTHQIPIESMRLKRIRDGREDYEYLKRVSQRGQRPEAKQIVKQLFGPPSVSMHSTTVSSQALYRARDALAALIDRGRR